MDDDLFSDTDSDHNDNNEFDLAERDQFFDDFECNLLDAELEGQI